MMFIKGQLHLSSLLNSSNASTKDWWGCSLKLYLCRIDTNWEFHRSCSQFTQFFALFTARSSHSQNLSPLTFTFQGSSPVIQSHHPVLSHSSLICTMAIQTPTNCKMRLQRAHCIPTHFGKQQLHWLVWLLWCYRSTRKRWWLRAKHEHRWQCEG